MRKCDIIPVININNFQIIGYSITDEHTNDAGGNKTDKEGKEQGKKIIR